MVLLDVLLAFALVMLGLATVVTVMVEFAHRVLRLRTRGMQQILERSCRKVLLPRIKNSIDSHSQLQRFTRQMMSNPLLMEEDSEIEQRQMGDAANTRVGKATKQVKWKLKRLELGSRIKWLGRSEDLDVVQCLQQLQHTDLYGQLKQDVQEELKDALESFADSYEYYCSAISTYFKRRAQLLSLVLGILLAFLANIDGLRIFNAFVQDPALATAVIAQQEKLESAHRQAEERLAQAQADTTEDDELQVSANAGTSQIMTLKSLGLPFGWDYFPGCGGARDISPDVLCQRSWLRPGDKAGEGLRAWFEWFVASEIYAYLTWAFKVLVTGFMIGLGGPFWFDVAQKLASIRRGMARQPGQAPTRGEQISAMSTQP